MCTVIVKILQKAKLIMIINLILTFDICGTIIKQKRVKL